MITSGSPIVDGLIAGFGAYLITSIVSFIIRLIQAPAALYNEKADRVDDLEAKLNPNVEWQIIKGLVSSSGSSKVCLVEIKNGNKTLRDCRINLDNQLIYKPFNLLPGDKKHIPIIKFPRPNSDTMTILYSYVQVDEKWQISNEVSRAIAEGTYHLKLVAENLYPPLEMTFNIVTHHTAADGWEITESRN